MNIAFTDEAQEDLESLTQTQRKAVKERLGELRDQPTSHDDVKLIRVNDRDVYRLRVRDRRGGEIDHRVIYDIRQGTIRVYSIFPRDDGYVTEL